MQVKQYKQSNIKLCRSVLLAGLVAFGLGAVPAWAQDSAGEKGDAKDELLPDWLSLHIQGTYLTQGHGPFKSDIADGQNSMLHKEQMAETADATLYLGVRLGQVELYFNPEMDQGYGPSSTYGMAAYPTGEAYKAGHYLPYYRNPRFFGRYVMDLGGETVNVEDAINQLSGSHTADNLTFTLGKFGVPDIFDTNTYAHDPKNDFINWAVVESGAFDYGAEQWGFTYGGAVEWTQNWWTLRGGFFNMSRNPNAAQLTENFQNNQTILEAEERHELFGQPGKVKVLGFLISANMGAYADALNRVGTSGVAPSTADVRHWHLRPGGGINIEQQIRPDLGVFFKASMNDGQYEEFDFTDINQSISTGISLKGTSWGRENDTFGLAGVASGISSNAQRYFAAGGMGGLIGDGALPSYGAEQVLEAYYRFGILPGVHLTLDYQHVINPAYDPARGPIDFFGFRTHLEY